MAASKNKSLKTVLEDIGIENSWEPLSAVRIIGNTMGIRPGTGTQQPITRVYYLKDADPSDTVAKIKKALETNMKVLSDQSGYTISVLKVDPSLTTSVLRKAEEVDATDAKAALAKALSDIANSDMSAEMKAMATKALLA